MTKLEELSWVWLETNYKITQVEIPNLVCYPHISMNHYVVEFYDSETNKIYHEWFITSDMVKQLTEGKNIKKIRNQYKKQN